MRQLSAPVRWAAVTALTIAASTGCMSVGEDGGKRAPARSSSDPKGASDAPDGGTVPGSGRSGYGGSHAEAQSDRRPGAKPDPSASGAKPSAAPAGTLPTPKAGEPVPTGAGKPPAPQPSAPGPGEPPAPPAPDPEPSSPPPPDPGPEPEPTPSPDPSQPPSASPAAQLRNHAMGAPKGPETQRTPEASPQVGPA